MISGRHIIFGINGFANAFAMECQNYDIGITKEGLTYPILLHENAKVQIHGKGQAMFGLKKLAYYPEATLKTPVFKAGYAVDGKSATKVKNITDTTEVDTTWKQKGAGINSEVYAEIKLKSESMSIDSNPYTEAKKRLNSYRKTRASTTPIFIKTKYMDDMITDVSPITLPSDIDGTITSYTETSSASENNIINDHTINIDCYGDFSNMYQALLQYKLLNGEPVIQIDSNPFVSAGEFIFKGFETNIRNYGDISLKLAGQNTILHSLKKTIGFIISYDDRKGYTDTKAMGNLCDMLNIPFETNITGVRIPETQDGQEGVFTFQPNVTFLDILTKLAGVQGNNLYISNGKVVYNKPVTTETLTLGRTSDYTCEGITYGQNDVFKSRVYVIGKAAESTKEHKAGDKLVGIWKSETIENQIGYDVFTKEDETLTNWDMVIQAGEKLWQRFNRRLYTIKFNIEDSRDIIDKIQLFNVFKWIDESYPALNNKLFTITGYTKDIDQTNCKASVTGVINEA
jgi:hypothetical protein